MEKKGTKTAPPPQLEPFQLIQWDFNGGSYNTRGFNKGLPSSKLTVRPCQIGVGRLVSIKHW